MEQVAPRLGERVLDPAAGTGGFLVEALEELRPSLATVEQWTQLQQGLLGIEKKPMPYLLGTMNLLLHGVEQPNIRRDNALATPLSQISTSPKVDVVLTNPPFGGEEEKGIQKNFPEATQTAETALLFLQFIQRSLKPGGRCGMVVPNGFMFGTGVASRVKASLMAECNVHTIVRLTKGVFAPYTDIPTNLLFFDKTGPTKEIWFYEHPLPEGRKTYVKTKPLKFEEFALLQEWWGSRVENDHAWRVPIGVIADDDYNLDPDNPNRPDAYVHVAPDELVGQILGQEEELAALLREIQTEVRAAPAERD
jgi:type I restriction enzyme M protein